MIEERKEVMRSENAPTVFSSRKYPPDRMEVAVLAVASRTLAEVPARSEGSAERP